MNKFKQLLNEIENSTIQQAISLFKDFSKTDEANIYEITGSSVMFGFNSKIDQKNFKKFLISNNIKNVFSFNDSIDAFLGPFKVRVEMENEDE
jgi:hypothetical protein